MLDRKDLVLGNSETKILWAIYETQQEQLKTLQEIKSLLLPAPAEQTGAIDFDSLKRNEIIALVKNLPEKPDSWTRMKTPDLINLLKEGAKQ